MFSPRKGTRKNLLAGSEVRSVVPLQLLARTCSRAPLVGQCVSSFNKILDQQLPSFLWSFVRRAESGDSLCVTGRRLFALYFIYRRDKLIWIRYLFGLEICRRKPKSAWKIKQIKLFSYRKLQTYNFFYLLNVFLPVQGQVQPSRAFPLHVSRQHTSTSSLEVWLAGWLGKNLAAARWMMKHVNASRRHRNSITASVLTPHGSPGFGETLIKTTQRGWHFWNGNYFFGRTSYTYPTVDVEGYCCAWLHIVRHILSVALPWTSNRPVAEDSTYTTHNKHKRETSMTPEGFEPAIPAIERPQRYAIRPHSQGDRWNERYRENQR